MLLGKHVWKMSQEVDTRVIWLVRKCSFKSAVVFTSFHINSTVGLLTRQFNGVSSCCTTSVTLCMTLQENRKNFMQKNGNYECISNWRILVVITTTKRFALHGYWPWLSMKNFLVPIHFTLVEMVWTFYILHGNLPVFFVKHGKVPGAYMETFCRITMQPPVFEIKVKTFPLLHQSHCFHA